VSDKAQSNANTKPLSCPTPIHYKTTGAILSSAICVSCGAVHAPEGNHE